jgi:hypothetical protein
VACRGTMWTPTISADDTTVASHKGRWEERRWLYGESSCGMYAGHLREVELHSQ